MMILGFSLWFLKLQKFQDAVIRLQVTKQQTDATPTDLAVQTLGTLRKAHKDIALDTLYEASEIKKKNVIDMAITFSAMNRVFEEGSKQKIMQKLENSLGLLQSVDGNESFEKIHSEFCEWFINNVSTAEKVLKNKKIKKSQSASYGQAAKVLNIATKVYTYYCQLPDCKSAVKLLPVLHAAVDTQMMKNLIKEYPKENISAVTIEAISKSEYLILQKLVTKHIEDKFNKLILPVQYDDIIWYRLNRHT